MLLLPLGLVVVVVAPVEVEGVEVGVTGGLAVMVERRRPERVVIARGVSSVSLLLVVVLFPLSGFVVTIIIVIGIIVGNVEIVDVAVVGVAGEPEPSFTASLQASRRFSQKLELVVVDFRATVK